MSHRERVPSNSRHVVDRAREVRVDETMDEELVAPISFGDEVVLRERPRTGREVFDILASLPDDFMTDGRDDGPPQACE